MVKIAMVSCFASAGATSIRKTADRLHELHRPARAGRRKEFKEVAPDKSASLGARSKYFMRPPERGGGQEKATEMDEKGWNFSGK